MKAKLTALCALLGVVFLAASLGAWAAGEVFDAHSAFEALKKLDGAWEGAATHGETQSVHVTYRVTGGGSAVVETLFPGTPHEMVTVYYLDGDKLRLTHYCAAGNQPRMVFRKSGQAGEIQFAFDGATNMKSSDDMHMHEMLVRILAPDHVVSEWTSYEGGKKSGTARFDLHPQK